MSGVRILLKKRLRLLAQIHGVGVFTDGAAAGSRWCAQMCAHLWLIDGAAMRDQPKGVQSTAICTANLPSTSDETSTTASWVGEDSAVVKHARIRNDIIAALKN